MSKVRRVGLLAALGLVVALVAAMASSAAPATHQASPLCKQAGVGFAGPLSGPAAFLGDDQHHWVQLFLSYWNSGKAIPGVPKALKRVKLVDALDGDSQLNPQQAATVGAQMVSNKTILGMVGFAGSNESLGGGPVLDRAKLAYVSGSATADNLTSKLKYFYRVVPNNTEQANAGITYITKALSLKKGSKVMVVDDGEAYGVGIADAAQKALTARGVSVDRESVPESTASSTADFTSISNKAVASAVKLVYAPTQTASDSQLFVQQLHSAGFKGGFMATDGSVDPTHFKYPGAYISFFGPQIGAVSKTFIQAYTAKYGKASASDPFGAPSFVAAQMLGVAISQSCAKGTTSRAAVAAALAKVKLATTILGYSMAFTNPADHKHGPSAGVTVFQIQSNGSYKEVYAAG